jgi:hypothetical protein
MPDNTDDIFEGMRQSARSLTEESLPDELAKTLNRLALAATMPECASSEELTAMSPRERWQMVKTVHHVASYLRTDVAFLLALVTNTQPELVHKAIAIAYTDADAVARAIADDKAAAKIAESDRRGQRIYKAKDN